MLTYTDTGGNYIQETTCTVTVLQEAAHLSDWQLSDHAIIEVKLQVKCPMQQKDQRIPAFIFKHPRFKRRVEQHVQQTSWEYLSVTRAWQTCKSIMVNAAQETRNELIQLPIGDASEGAEDARRLTMRSIARCVWLQDARLASKW